MEEIIAHETRCVNNETTTKKRKRFKPSFEHIDESVYAELQIEDDRNAETIGIALGKSKSTIQRSLERLEALGMVRLDPMPNGNRSNARYRKIKLTGNDQVRDIDPFNAPHFGNWNQKTREQLIKRYQCIGWNVIPLTQDKQPIMDQQQWATLRPDQQRSIFMDQVYGVGMWIEHLLVFEFNHVDEDLPFETLTAKTPNGFAAYFLRTPKTRHIYSCEGVRLNVNIKTRGSFVVLPPTHGYQWANVVPPTHLYYYPELLDLWKQFRLQRAAAASTGKTFKKYVLPDRLAYPENRDHLFRYGRSLRARGATPYQIVKELRRVNREVCVSPIDDLTLDVIIERVLVLENDPSFVVPANEKS